MFRRTVYVALALLVLVVSIDARKTSSGRSRGSSSRGTSRRTQQQSAPTSFNPQPSAPKPETSHSGWQTKAKETPVKSSQASVSHQSRASGQSHSYPSSQTGLSGNQQPPPYQQSVQQSHSYPQNNKPQQVHTYPQSNAQPGQSNPSQAHTYPQSNPSQGHAYPPQPSNAQSHAYPASGGLSGHSGVGAGYPQSSGGLSGNAPPAYPGGQASRPGYPAAAGGAYPSNNYGNSYHPPAHGPPPAYPGNHGYGNPGYNNPGYGHGGYGNSGYGGAGGFGGYGQGGFGGNNYGKYYGGVSRGSSTLSKVGIAGAGVGTLLTGLALWNLARSGGSHRTYIYQDHRGNPIPVPMNDTTPVMDPLLGELVNCTLTINGANATEVLGIPCAIATSFSPNSDLTKGVDTSGSAEEAKCTITVVTKNGTELLTTIPCSILLNTAKEANVTEPPPFATNGTDIDPATGQPIVNGSEIIPPGVGVPLVPIIAPNSTPILGIDYQGEIPLAPINAPNNSSLLPGSDPTQNSASSIASPLVFNPSANVPIPDCKLEPGATADPINPCMPAMSDVSVIPLNGTSDLAPAAA